jgi:hypothetical protein
MINSESQDKALQPRLRESLERVLPELTKLRRTELAPLNLDPLAFTAMVQAVIPAAMELRPEIETLIPSFDFRNLDQLETYCLALVQSHALYISVKAPSAEFLDIIQEAIRLRSRLSIDAKALVNRGLIHAAPQSSGGKSKGYKNIAKDVLTLSNLLRASWDTVSSKCAVSKKELDRAEVLADRIIQFLGYRDRAPHLLAEAAQQRQKVFTLLMNAYSQVRRAVTYVRWDQGDSEKIAPSPYGGKRMKPKAVIAKDTNTQSTLENGVAPSVTPTNEDPFEEVTKLNS